jgi:hypothetical protein
MLNQAIDQFRIHLTSPQFHRYGNPLDSSLQLKPPHHPFTPDIANNPFLGLEDNMSPFKYRQEEPAQKAQPDPGTTLSLLLSECPIVAIDESLLTPDDPTDWF